MGCYSPLHAIVLGINKDTGKKKIKILANSDFKFEDKEHEYITIPCGRCIGCRLKYSRDWADRCMVEAQYHDSNLFITLTYDDEHLPEPNEIDFSDNIYDTIMSECLEKGIPFPDLDKKRSPIHPLVKRDVQLFIKRLRKKFSDQKIRYFLCGEYGSNTMRPHYHLILFGLELSDQQLLYKNDDDFRYFTSDSISELWPFGFHIITSVNWSVCAYVARYIVKKQYGQGSSIYEKYNFPPEFTLMSRKPGIGRQFYEDNKLRLYGDDVYVPLEDGARKIHTNKYYDSLYDIEYPDHMEVIREERKKIALINNQLKSNLTNLEYLDRLKSEELNQLDKIKNLKRKEL